MKRLAALLPFLLAACGSPPEAKALDRIECALDGASAFERLCTIERDSGRDALFTLRGPSGSFRRLAATRDGRGVTAADGAEPATVTVIGKDLIEVSIGRDRYRLPARVR
ncbi:MAG: hypothetical protein QOJ91_1497 [Sphingomonadales bacterium]|jgi:hypothetical protein|nr:hypothetical protein [Sphingomonadales bacterium]